MDIDGNIKINIKNNYYKLKQNNLEMIMNEL